MILLLIIACRGHTAVAGTLPSTLRFDQVGLDAGLAQDSALAIAQDARGFLWIGTQGGLSRYDGYRVVTFRADPANPRSVPDNWINALYADRAGSLWVGSRSGLARYDADSESFQRFELPATERSHRAARNVRAVIGDGGAGLWLATSDGLQHLDVPTGQFDCYHNQAGRADSISSDQVWALLNDEEGNLLIGTSRGIDLLPRGGTQFHRLTGLTDPTGDARSSSVRAIWKDPSGILWVGTLAGLRAFRRSGDALVTVEQAYSSSSPVGAVNALLGDRAGDLWIGTATQGLLQRPRDASGLIAYLHEAEDPHSLAANQVTALFQSGEGVLWVGTRDAGLSHVDLASGGFQRILGRHDSKPSLSSNRISSIAVDSQDRAWVATFDGGLNRIDRREGTIVTIRHDPKDPASLDDDAVNSVHVDSADRVWIGTGEGIALFDPAAHRLQRYRFGRGDPAENNVFDISEDRRSLLWIGTEDGLHRFDPASRAVQSWHHDAADPGSLSPGKIYTVLNDQGGNLWVATENGLDRMEGDGLHFSHFIHDPKRPDSLSHDRVYTLHEDRHGTLWAGTAGGLNRISIAQDGKVSFQVFLNRDGIGSDIIGGIEDDEGGRLWISTTSGISRFDPATGKFKNYTAHDGLIDGAYRVGAASHGRDGLLYFGGERGLTVFQPTSIQDNATPPAVALTSLLINNVAMRPGALPANVRMDRSITTTGQLQFDYDVDVVSLEFAALHWSDPRRNRYAYRLEGQDRDWVRTDAEHRFATYTRLVPGDYLFRVKAANKDGVWNDTGTAITISVLPPFWMTRQFRVMAVLLFLAGASLLYRQRIRQLTERQSLLASQVAARTAEIERQKSLVEQQKEAVERAHRTISLLSEMGREITAQLTADDIGAILYRHVRALMPVESFSLYLYNADNDQFFVSYCVERGVQLQPRSFEAGNGSYLSAWCIARREAIYINDAESECPRYSTRPEETLAALRRAFSQEDPQKHVMPRSIIMVPLLHGERSLGIIGISTTARGAYEPVHVEMLRTLAAYTAIAIENADTYRQLGEAHRQLVQQETMASLGRLVAGVAHEANTPIGNIRTSSSTLSQQVAQFSARLESGRIQRTAVEEFLAFLRECADIIERASGRAADLISNFKQLAVDQSTSACRQFEIGEILDIIVKSMAHFLRKHHIEIAIRAEPELRVFGEPGRFEQVIVNLMTNAATHAFEGLEDRRIVIDARRAGRHIQLDFSDNGIGIAPELHEKIFEPFFTTRFGQGGSGLGLYIVHSIVTSIFNGRISVISGPSQGTTFRILIPFMESSDIGRGSE